MASSTFARSTAILVISTSSTPVVVGSSPPVVGRMPKMQQRSSHAAAGRPALGGSHDTAADAAGPSDNTPGPSTIHASPTPSRSRGWQQQQQGHAGRGGRGGGGGDSAGRGRGVGGDGRWTQQRPPASFSPANPATDVGNSGPSSSGYGRGPAQGGRHQQQYHQQQRQPLSQPFAGRPSSFRPATFRAAAASAASASTTTNPGPAAAAAAPRPTDPANSASVRPPKAKKVDSYAHLPVYDYQTYPPSRPAADRPTLLLLSDPTLVDEAVAHLGSPVGLDIEWAPTFKAGAPTKPTSLLQISDGQTILVIQTLSLLGRCPPGLRAFLEDPEIIKLGAGILPDGTKLSSDLGVDCQGFFDLNALRPPDPHHPKLAKGLAALTGIYTQHRLHKSKNVTMSNWALARLSPSQIAYAANDVQSAVDIYAALRAEAAASGFSLKGPSGWSWSASRAIPTYGKRVPHDLVQRVAAAPGAVDYSSSGFYPPGVKQPPPSTSKPSKPDPNEWWAQAVELFKEGRSLLEIQATCKPATQQSRSSMDVRFGIVNYLTRRSESITEAQGKVLLTGLALDTKGRLPLTVMVQELVRQGEGGERA